QTLAERAKASFIECTPQNQRLGHPLEASLEVPPRGIDSMPAMHRHCLEVAIEARREQGGVFFSDSAELLAQMAERLRAALRRRIDRDELCAGSERRLRGAERSLIG